MMKDIIDQVQPFPIMISLSEADQNLACKFADEQTTPAKREQVYFNTLAVLAVNHFLGWMEIETDLNAGESWNRVVRTFHNVADLVLPDLGILECRLVKPGAKVIDIPPEVRENRIGCVVVEFYPHINTANLRGCYLTSEQESELPEQIQIHNLSPLETLLDHLDWLEMLKSRGGLINLRAFLTGLVASDWEQEPENLSFIESNAKSFFRSSQELNTNNSEHLESINNWLAKLQSSNQLFRQQAAKKLGEIGNGNSDVIAALTQLLQTDNHADIHWQAAISLGKIAPGHPQAGVKFKKLINLTENQAVNLVMSCKPDKGQSIMVRVQVRPVSPEVYLPAGCKLAIIDEFGKVFGKEAIALTQDNYLQRLFRIDPGDRFGVKIGLGDESYIEHCIG